jgi:hypothetical protein
MVRDVLHRWLPIITVLSISPASPAAQRGCVLLTAGKGQAGRFPLLEIERARFVACKVSPCPASECLPAAEVLAHWSRRSVVHSCCQLSYDDAQMIIDLKTG